MAKTNVPHLDMEERIDSSGCGKAYRELDECLLESDRDWRKCQKQVKAFRECMKKNEPDLNDGRLCLSDR